MRKSGFEEDQSLACKVHPSIRKDTEQEQKYDDERGEGMMAQ